jgi:predicted CoA-substrate-specific enzyme activase
MSKTNSHTFLGIDAGSRTIKATLISADSEILASGFVNQGVKQTLLAKELLDSVLSDAGLGPESISFTVATGYGRDRIDMADTTFSEITCHARGVMHLTPHARTIIDIGGQDSKLIKLDERGHVHDFAMNDRCAAGTGRFLEVVAQRLEVSLPDLDSLATSSTEPCTISSTCVVFAETEIVGLLAQEISPADITAGIFAAIASRTQAMAGRKLSQPVAFTGGAALFSGLHRAIEQVFDTNVEVVANPRLTGSLGAALIAKDKAGELSVSG